MCHPFSLAWEEADLCTRFGVPVLPTGLVSHYSIAPEGTALVVTESGLAGGLTDVPVPGPVL